MILDLRTIIGIPGASLPFEYRLETDSLDFPFDVSFCEAPYAVGEVQNSAGALTLVGKLRCNMTLRCDRCAKTYEFSKTIELNQPLAADLSDEENPDIFPIIGDSLDLDELLRTLFILDMDTKRLCREDCAGLCESCGADLNLDACACRPKLDPRLAVLEQLLDIDNQI